MTKEYALFSEELGEEFRHTSILEIYKEWRRLVEDDKVHHDKKTYYFLRCEIEGNTEYQTEVKIYKRHNKVYAKPL